MKYRGQASFFDGLMFMFVVVFSISMVFLTLNNYAVAQDKVLRTAYLSNYLQSVAKVSYFVDVSTLQNVQSYCDDLDFRDQFNPGNAPNYYCNGQVSKYKLNCGSLREYKGHISVADLVKKDVDPTDGGAFDDKFGSSKQMGRTALRCAMKEIMKPFSFSGYRYLTEVGSAQNQIEDAIRYAEGELYASDYMYSADYQALDAGDKATFSCAKVNSDQLLVIRTPFKVLTMANSTFDHQNFVLRTCLWPSNDLPKPIT